MTDKQFYNVWGDAKENRDIDAFVSEWCLSDMFCPNDPEKDVPLELISELRNIWHVAHMSFKELRATTGLSQIKFAEHFCVSRRTVENWEIRECCPSYVKLMMAEILGLIKR